MPFTSTKTEVDGHWTSIQPDDAVVTHVEPAAGLGVARGIVLCVSWRVIITVDADASIQPTVCVRVAYKAHIT